MAAQTNGELAEGAASTNGNESPYVKELQKNIRNITKKLGTMHKTDNVIAENPGVSLDQLVAQRKINQDQKASALKKPQLQAQLTQLEEQVQQYRKFDSETQNSLQKQKEELSKVHAEELEKAREAAKVEARQASGAQLKSQLLVFSQFLRAAAAKRAEDETAESDENRAFEGVLLLVYGGDQKAVDSAAKIIEGSEEKAPSIDGTPTGVTYAQIKQASIEHSPFQLEEAWVDSVAEANASSLSSELNGQTTLPGGSDPTIVNAGLTELDSGAVNGLTAAHDERAGQQQSSTTDAANKAGDRWDTNPAADSTEGAGLEESYEVIPRPDEEVDIPSANPADSFVNSAGTIDTGIDAGAGSSWADQAPVYDTTTPLADSWSSKPSRGQSNGVETDGFQKVAGRSRGQRGSGGHHRGEGEHRGRGRGRGGRGGFGGRGRGDGEFRGRGGRGRGGPRGDAAPKA